MNRITIICKSASNTVTEVTSLLSEHNINIQKIDFNQFGEDAFLSISVSDYEKAFTLITDKGYNTIAEEVVLLRGKDQPGELARISRKLTDLGVQIRSLTLVDVSSGGSVAAISTTDNERVRELFADRIVN